MEWVRFHNGVAAGLRVSPRVDVDDDTDQSAVDDLTRTWISYNRLKTNTSSGEGESKNASAAQTGPLYDPKGTGMSTPEHAGFLLAMGLQGHLKHGIKKPDVHDYLKARHSLTTMAILLGEASTHCGTMDLATRKMLCLHIPSLLPHTISEYDHAPCVQNAAVVGIGLLYMGTVHRLMAEFLIGEVGRRPANDRGCVDRESYGKYSKRRRSSVQSSCNNVAVIIIIILFIG